MIRRLIILLLIVGCDNSTEPKPEVEVVCVEINSDGLCIECIGGYELLWDVCYSIVETDSLDLSGNFLNGWYGGLSGEIPPEIGNLTNLTNLLLNDNQLTGSIPSEIGNLTNLTNLLLNDNQFTGSIPSAIGNLTSIYKLSLHDNQLTGEIPDEIGNLTNLWLLNLSDNRLTGSIPSEIGSLTGLTYLILKNNHLSGLIPPEIANLTYLDILYLNDNQLSGSISESICNLSIDWNGGIYGPYFDISNNQFCPPYPSCIQNYVGDQDTSNCP